MVSYLKLNIHVRVYEGAVAGEDIKRRCPLLIVCSSAKILSMMPPPPPLPPPPPPHPDFKQTDKLKFVLAIAPKSRPLNFPSPLLLLSIKSSVHWIVRK